MVARAPGYNSPIYKPGSGLWTIKIGTSSSSNVRNDNILFDYRPSYPKGQHKQVGSRFWRLPTTYYHASRVVSAPGTAVTRKGIYECSESNPGVAGFLTNQGFPVSPGGSRFSPNSWNAAIVKSLNDLAQQEAGIGEDLATFVQTARMFKDTGTRLRDILRAAKNDAALAGYLRSKSFNKGSRAAKAYLEYEYGWKPLVSDLYGLYKVLQEYAAGLRPVIIHGRGTVRSQSSKVIRYKEPGWELGNYWVRGTSESNSRVSAHMYAKFKPEWLAFRVLNQIGLLNPASIAWAVVPWSFVVDWFIPIGPFLEALTAPVGLDFVSGSVSEKLSRVHRGEWHTSVGATGNTVDEPINYTVTDELYYREGFLSWPVTMPYLNLNPLSGDRSFKALALSIAQLNRGVR